MITKEDWLRKILSNKMLLREYIDRWHPNGTQRAHQAPMPVTAATPELVRQRLLDDIKTKDPAARFDEACERHDFMTIHKLLDETWFGVPESTSCWKIPGFSLSVDLMDDPPEPEVIDVEVDKREINESRVTGILLTCECCGFVQQFKDGEEAFEAGWDAPPHFTQFIVCSLCPTAGIVLSMSAGNAKDSMHKKAHAHWRDHGRPEEFNALCLLDSDFDAGEKTHKKLSLKMGDDVCRIDYEEDGVRKEWLISAHPLEDNAVSLEKHLRMHRPNAIFIGFEFIYYNKESQ